MVSEKNRGHDISPRRPHDLLVRPLTIGIDGSFLARDNRGMGRSIRSVLRCWKDKTPHRLVLLCHKSRHLGGLQPYEKDGWEVHAANSSPNLDVCWFPWNRIDWDSHCPRVVFIHDVGPFTSYHPDNRHKETDQLRLREAVTQADLVMTNSSFSRAEIHRHLNYPLENMEVIYLAYDKDTFKPASEPATDLPAGLQSGQFMLFVGNLEPRKNLRGLLEGLALGQKEIDLPLALVCPRPSSTWTERLRGKMNSLQELTNSLEDQLVWLDSIEDRQLVQLYQNARLFVMPSLYEGFGLPLLEAMACGCPLAAARASSLPEVGGQVPRWFNPKDQVDIARVLIEALALPPDSNAAALEQASHFSWEVAANEVLSILEHVAEKPHHPSSGASGVFPAINLDNLE